MSATTRKALYGLIPAAVALLTAYGILTSTLAVLWGNVATLAVGFGYAASRATGNRFGDPEVRRYLYVLAPAVVALIGGYVSLDVALWTSLVLAVLGAALAGLNVDPDEQAGADAGLDIIDAPKTGKAKGVLRTAMASLTALILTGALLVGPASRAEALPQGCTTGQDTKVVNRVVQYRVWAKCSKKLPGKSWFQARGLFSLYGTGVWDIERFGPKTAFGSGRISRTGWQAHPYWANGEGRLVRVG